jgi:chromosomal replication initiator protein
MDNFWPDCLTRFEKELSAQQFNTWIKPLQFKTDGEYVRLFAPNRFVMQWVKDRFLKKIEQFAIEFGFSNIQIDILLMDVESKNEQASEIKALKETSSDESITIKNLPIKEKIATLNKIISKKNNEPTGLNTSFNFANYVTGRANQLARAAAIQVAENPGTA